MDRRAPPPGATAIRRPSATLQRAASGGSYGFAHQIPKRPTLATTSGLSNVRSVSQPVDLDDLSERVERLKDNVAAYWENSGAMVRSPDGMSPEEEDDDEQEDLQPPAKRARIARDSGRAEGEEMESSEPDVADQIMPGQPLPGLTALNLNRGMRDATGRQQRQCHAVDPALRKARGLDPPTLATKAPPPKKVLDYSPWTGSHPEDVLTETVIKNGYSENPKTNQQNESNSARASIWPQLTARNHAGLQMLSYLYSQVMEKRQAIGRCTAPSTFKPPPRVTVTDTKREAWLRDLANPDVPLRKQSRTIPHGIRGKLLMEQCLTKSIPLQRAVWLAKCVGANELRAFRRKGVSGPAAASGEAKWVREWTIQVEQFLESVIGMCGQHEWKEKMNYTVKLSTALFSEKLLDIEHFLDWIVTCLSEATLDQLPIWIVLAQLYWKPLLAYGKRGNTLAESLLEHLHRVEESGLEVNAPLRTRLQKLVAVLAVNNRGCLILPRVWLKYKTLLQAPPTADTNLLTAMNEVGRRNARLAAPLDLSPSRENSPLLKLYRHLDLVGLDVDVEKLATECSIFVPNPPALVTALLEWASTLYRTGSARIYLAARLIAHTKANGADTDSVILQYLGGAGNVTLRNKQNLYLVIIELVRLESFSVGRYLQWLITSGAGSSGNKEDPACGLLTALPSTGLPVHMLNTRATLLRRLGFNVNETAQVEQVVENVVTALEGTSSDASSVIALPESLSLSSRLNVSRSVSDKLSTMAKAGAISLSAFHFAREMMEQTGDLPGLADVAHLASASEITSLLASVCDTINYHAGSFAALGRLQSLVDVLSEHYMLVRSQQPLDRTLIVALSGLIQRTTNKASFIKLLSDDLAICDQQNSLAVCSPASDSIIGMHATTLDSEHDIDAVFASGNTMDEQLMQRVFIRIMQYTTKNREPSIEPVSKVCNWLSQLRLVDGGGAFDGIVMDWLRAVLQSSHSQDLPLPAIESLIASGSLAVHHCSDMAKQVASASTAAAVLHALLSTETTNTELSDSERYKLSLYKEQAKADQPQSLALLLRYAAESLDLLTGDRDLLRFCIRRSSTAPGTLRTLFEGDNLSDAVKANVGLLVKGLLQIEAQSSYGSDKLDVDVLVGMAGPLSATFCVEALRWSRSNANWTAADDDVFKKALLASFNSNADAWPQLLDVAGDKVNASIHEWAWENVLRLADADAMNDGQQDGDYLQRCVNLLVATNGAASKADGAVHVELLSAKLKELEKAISTSSQFEANSSEAWEKSKYRLSTYLRLCTMHVHSIANESEASKLARLSLLSTLCALLVISALQIDTDLIEYIFDHACTLSNNLLDDTFTAQKVYNSLKSPPDQRLAFILGANTSATSSWLALAHPVAPAAGSAQQRILSRQSSQHHLQGPSGSQGSQNQHNRTPTSFQPVSSPAHLHQRFNSQGGQMPPGARMPVEIKTTPFTLRRWEIMSDPTPVMGENDGSLSLGLFAARRV